MIEHILTISGKLFHFIYCKTTEITHLMAEINIMLLISCFLGSMCCENQPCLDLIEILVEFIVQVKCSRKTMCFIQMIPFRIETDLIQQFCSANSKQNELSHLRCHIRIIQPVGDRLRNV